MNHWTPSVDNERLTRQETELATLRARLTALEHARRRSRRGGIPLVVAVLVSLVALLPLTLVAAPRIAEPPNYHDYNPGSPHNDNINAIAVAGITRGCNPPTNDRFCPNDLVTREQMASFLARTAGLGTNAPTANALTAVNAQDAARLGGVEASQFLRASSSVQVSDLVATGAVRISGDLELHGAISSDGFRLSVPLRNAKGPLPVTGQFTSGGGVLLVIVTGTAAPFLSTPTLHLTLTLPENGLTLHIDTAAGQVSTRQTLVGHLIILPNTPGAPLPAGSHQFQLSAGTGTVTDADDHFTVTILELPIRCTAADSCH